MFLQGVILFCMAIVHAPLAYAQTTKFDEIFLHALNLDPRDVTAVDLITIIIPKKLKDSFGKTGTSMTVRGIGEEFQLNLHPRDSTLVSKKTQVFLVNENANKSGGVEYVLQKNAMNNVGTLLEDPLHRASVVLGTDEHNEPTITAVIGGKSSTSGMIIRSLPPSVLRAHFRKRRFIDDISMDDEDSESTSIRAVAVNLKNMERHKYVDLIKRRKREMLEHAEVQEIDGVTRSDEQYEPRVLYPKILVAADSSYYRNWSSDDLVRSLEYILTFFNTIDLYFRPIEDPIIKLHIVAITIATTHSATPYIAKHMDTEEKSFDHFKAIEDMSTYFYNVKDEISLKYDIAFSLTQSHMMGDTKGTSIHGGVCNDSSGRMNGVVLVYDNGVFGEIEAAVHELGHSFGLPDDDKEEPYDCSALFEGHYTSIHCSNPPDYIMAPLSTEKRQPTFSDDSLSTFDDLLERGALSCMYEKPSGYTEIVLESAPSKVPNLTEQCQAYGKVGPCPGYEDNMCTRLRCIEPSIIYNNVTISRCIAFFHPAATGTPCKIKDEPHPGFCFHNRCVSL